MTVDLDSRSFFSFLLIVIPAEVGIQGYYSHLLRSYIARSYLTYSRLYSVVIDLVVFPVISSFQGISR